MKLVVTAALAWSCLASPARAASAPSPVNPAAGWATAYLLNAAFAAEYESVLASASGLSPTARREFLRAAPARALWTRASFALAAMQAKGQSLPSAPRLAALLRDHVASLPDAASVAAQAQSLTRAAESDLLTQKDPGVVAGFGAVAGSFGPAPVRQRWEKLASSYSLPSPTCPIDYRDVKAFAEHQKAQLAGGKGLNPVALTQPLAGWSLAKVQCLAFTLMASSAEAKAKDGFEPLHLLRALQQTGSPMARDLSLRALLAVRYLQLSRYAETLSVLMDLADMDEAYRLPYETVQRVYSLKQKGDGSVALQGL